MSVEGNKAMLRRGFEEGVNRGNFAVVDELIGPSYVNHSFPDARGPEGFKQVIGMFRSAFPDICVTVEEMIAEGEKVATRGTWRGTQRGAFMGIPPTGRQITVSYSDFWRIENGKAVENWVQMDLLGLMQQLGVIPAPGAAPV